MEIEVQCVYCEVPACKTNDIEEDPYFCPRRHAQEELKEAQKIRQTDPFAKRITDAAQDVLRKVDSDLPRARELIEFAKCIKIRKLGLAFCVSLKEEAINLATILESHGFSIFSVACTVNGGCNPIAQALVLNKFKTELNIIMGLCMGHDILFSKYSQAPITTLVVKDRATYHNPVITLVERHWRYKLFGDAFRNEKDAIFLACPAV